ncbi:precorrin-6y C5,15-methyltransferase (decarboxylating) subunit CbiE [Luteococcus sp. H138]|uniref:precorrin-6y C5,15-methyltransferase (decarboxylating) subunit CbiE n=1 Tax=unclassified Luteococcus TaxID=2639923 RepID=UPI00313A81FF
MSLERPVDVVGVGADGWDGLPDRLRRLVLDADVLLGGARHLAMIPGASTGSAAAAGSLSTAPEKNPTTVPEPVEGSPRPTRLPWPSPLREKLPALLDSLPADAAVVVLASGDPLVSGIGTTLIGMLGAERVRIHPAASSVALARAELRWSAESCAVVSVVGRDVSLINRELAPGRRVIVLSSDEHTPAQIAELLVAAGYGASILHVLGNLGAPDQTHRTGRAAGWQGDSPRLNIVGLELDGPLRAGWTAGAPDNLFAPLTPLPRDERAVILARLAPVPGEHLWTDDASVAIEWLRCHPSCTATCLTAEPDDAMAAARNLGVPGLVCVAPEAGHTTLTRPDAVFWAHGASHIPATARTVG